LELFYHKTIKEMVTNLNSALSQSSQID